MKDVERVHNISICRILLKKTVKILPYLNKCKSCSIQKWKVNPRFLKDIHKPTFLYIGQLLAQMNEKSLPQ